jgi:hypothetical protein
MLTMLIEEKEKNLRNLYFNSIIYAILCKQYIMFSQREGKNGSL